jgi:1-acyl-sn-glycerol-3-phosphate acyltransferase
VGRSDQGVAANLGELIAVTAGDCNADRISDIYAPEMSVWLQSNGAFRAPAAGSALFEGFCKVFFSCYCPLTVEGRNRLPDGPFLLCSNHMSHADSAALMTASGRSFRDFALLGARDYFFNSHSVRWLVSPLMNVIPIERRPGAKSLAACLETCRRFVDETGGSLILYPEGTRSPDGEMQAFRAGAGLFAIELGLPVVPAYIDGTHHILPKGSSMPRVGRVAVRFGEVLSLSTLSRHKQFPRDRRHYVVERLSESIRQLNPADPSLQRAVVGFPQKG